MKYNKLIAAITLFGTLAVAGLYWHVDKPPTAFSDVPLPEWSDGPPSVSFSNDCDVAWWSRGVTDSLRAGRALKGIAQVEEYACTLSPGTYERVLDIDKWPAASEEVRVKEAREVLGYLHELLLGSTGENDELCQTPGWKPGAEQPFVSDKWIRYDGAHT